MARQQISNLRKAKRKRRKKAALPGQAAKKVISTLRILRKNV